MGLLDTKVAMVTSSTRGIGFACAQTLARNGAKVYFAVRRLDAGQELADALKAEGCEAEVVFFDADQPDTFRSSVEEVVTKEGRIDILVNNYGGTDVKHDHDLLHTTSADFMKIVEGTCAASTTPVNAPWRAWCSPAAAPS